MKASMDADKMLLTLPDGKTLLQTSLEIYSAVPFQEILVILPERFRHSLALPDSARVLVNPNADSGMASSVVLGVESASPQARGCMIALGDMPLIRTASIEALCEAFLRKADPTAICAPFFQEKRGNPVLFGNAYKQDLLHLSGDVGAKILLKKYSDHVMEIAVNDEGIVRDIDSAEDWREFVVQH
jgi:molybdenum cofactor cytidylyltransferase